MNASLPRIAPNISTINHGLSPYFKSGAGTSVMVSDQQRAILDAMHAMATKPSSEGYHALSMTKAVERLRAGGDLPNAQMQPGRPQRRCLVHSGFEIEYEVSPGLGGQGAIEIVDIRLTRNLAKGAERAGLWDIQYSKSSNAEAWEVKEWMPNLEGIPSDSKLKVGINGYSGTLPETADLMSSHITRGNKKKAAELKSSGFHLFFTPTPGALKAGWHSILHGAGVPASSNDTKNAQILAAYMYEAHKKSMNIEWVSHRGGAYVLTAAMKLLAQKNINLDKKQSIFMSDTTSNYAIADKYRRQLNMDIDNSKWVDGGYGAGFLAGGSAFGLAKIQTEWTLLKKDTTKDNFPGKGVTFARNVTKIGKNTMASLGSGYALYGAFGINGAFAAAVLKLLPLIASSVPAFSNEYQKHEGQALENAINKGVKQLSKGIR